MDYTGDIEAVGDKARADSRADEPGGPQDKDPFGRVMAHRNGSLKEVGLQGMGLAPDS
jgi:hypothetical protein